MARHSVLSKEAREHIIGQLREKGELTKSEVVELIRPHCTFDPVHLQEQMLNRIASGIIRSIRDDNGVRTAFIIRKTDTVIDIETCKSLPKVRAVEDLLSIQIDGLKMSRNKARNRRMELEGQLDFFNYKAAAS